MSEPENLDDFLTEGQLRCLHVWQPGARLEADLSWHETDTLVLQVESGGRRFTLKSAGEDNHHFDRELQAHRGHTAAMVAAGYCAPLIAFSRSQRLMLLDYLPGVLADKTPASTDQAIHHQAGIALKILHDGHSRVDEGYEARLIAKCRQVLGRKHRIPAPTEQAIVHCLDSFSPQAAMLVPTHGDWQPRNWLTDAGKLRVIDFGRFEFRPAATDLVRLASQQWKGRPDLESAFFAGYGTDPRSPRDWPLLYLQEAIGTAVWAYSMGAEEFEAQGHRMLADALEMFGIQP